MFGIFSRKKDKGTVNSKSLITIELKDDGRQYIFFNEKFANRQSGEYQYDSKGAFEKIGTPKDETEAFKKYTIFEWAHENKSFVEANSTLFSIRRDEDDIVKDTLNKVLILPPIKIGFDGTIEIIKHEGDEIKNEDLICIIHPKGLVEDENNPGNDIYEARFDKFEIPKEIRDLNSITGKFIFLSKWLKTNGSWVDKGEDIFEVKGGSYDKIYYTYRIKAKASGILEILKSETESYVSDELEQKEMIYLIYKDNDIRFNHRYFNKSELFEDEFNGNKILKWEIVGGYLYPFNSDIESPIDGVISTSINNKELIFSFQNHESRDYIVLNYFSNEYRLVKGDAISFLFDSKEIIEFEIVEKSYKSNYNWKNLYETKIPISERELHLFKDNKLFKWKIELKANNEQITGEDGNSWYSGADFRKVIQNLSSDYCQLVGTVIENRTVLNESEINEKVETDKVTDSCYVYLMIDTTNNYHKIGISNAPEYREKTLQSEKPTIELIIAKEYPTRKIAESIEKALHSAFLDRRIRGEWFELTDENINEIKQTLT